MPTDYLKQYTSLKQKMNDFAKVNFFQYNNVNEPTGIFCSVYTFIKKDIVLDRVKEIISSHKYPFTVSEDGLVNTNHFIVKF